MRQIRSGSTEARNGFRHQEFGPHHPRIMLEPMGGNDLFAPVAATAAPGRPSPAARG